jgi:transcriptional regulator with XRE-family HTH domain
MSKATLSGVESGRSNPTIETLASLAAALRVSLGELLEEPPLGEVRIVRRGQHGVLDRIDEEGVELSERLWPPRQLDEHEPGQTGTRAGVYVLEGKLIAGPVERVTELTNGDYASFPTDVPHVFETERTGARALVLTYPT